MQSTTKVHPWSNLEYNKLYGYLAPGTIRTGNERKYVLASDWETEVTPDYVTAVLRETKSNHQLLGEVFDLSLDEWQVAFSLGLLSVCPQCRFVAAVSVDRNLCKTCSFYSELRS